MNLPSILAPLPTRTLPPKTMLPVIALGHYNKIIIKFQPETTIKTAIAIFNSIIIGANPHFSENALPWNFLIFLKKCLTNAFSWNIIKYNTKTAD
jgi:hypothetical protein